MELGQICASNSFNAILVFTQPNKNGQKASLLLYAIGRNKAVRDTIIQMCYRRAIIYLIIYYHVGDKSGACTSKKI